MRLAIFGGTFNPIHLGHLLLAETARETLTLDRVVFIPTRQPPHKRAAELLPGEIRLKLIELAIHHHPAFVCSDIELQRAGPSYSIETARALHGQLPQATLFLLLGADMLTVRWLAWEELKRLCTIVAAHRPGSVRGEWQARRADDDLRPRRYDRCGGHVTQPPGGCGARVSGRGRRRGAGRGLVGCEGAEPVDRFQHVHRAHA